MKLNSFNEEKIVQIIGYLLNKTSKKCFNYNIIIKILYFADRKAISILSQTITGDSYYNTKNGIILKYTYGFIKNEFEEYEGGFWKEYIERVVLCCHDMLRETNYGNVIEKGSLEGILKSEKYIKDVILGKKKQLDLCTGCN